MSPSIVGDFTYYAKLLREKKSRIENLSGSGGTEAETLEKKAKILKEENAFLENKIHFLRSDNLDLDLLDEQARNILGFANEEDIIVMLPK